MIGYVPRGVRPPTRFESRIVGLLLHAAVYLILVSILFVGIAAIWLSFVTPEHLSEHDSQLIGNGIFCVVLSVSLCLVWEKLIKTKTFLSGFYE